MHSHLEKPLLVTLIYNTPGVGWVHHHLTQLLQEQPTANYKYQTNSYGSQDSALFRIGDNYVAPPNILPTKNISTLNEENVNADWLLMFARHLPYLNPSYSSAIAMGLEVKIQEDVDWVKNAINWVKSFFGKDLLLDLITNVNS